MKKALISSLAVLGLILSTVLPAAYAEKDNKKIKDTYSGGSFYNGSSYNYTNILPFGSEPDDDIPYCQGTFSHEVSDVTFQAVNVGGDQRSLTWGFELSSKSAKLGPTVAVSMPVATVNDNPINPPYQTHTNTVTYNYHGSLKKYGYIGKSGGGVLEKNDIVFFTWLINSVKDPKQGAYRYIKCRVK
ncbi:hypothetical protein [Brevibacillus laterosporus]|uniref:hypothetical protein n=1 Tax=Brevibacillus laterosporus TaxID=1465 RepID=UPI000B9BDDC6|nr:hypothetical protein [Brevibacillus laterosporus]MBG9788865.1 hypothetical protein [Brevibacillus laterosporus]MCG7320249.1 hypothetical protein [Brevibacillus laterosporus]